MKITVLDDWSRGFKQLACYSRLKDHEVTVYHDTEKDPDRLAARIHGAEALILTQERSAFPRELIEKLTTLKTTLKIVAQTGSHQMGEPVNVLNPEVLKAN